MSKVPIRMKNKQISKVHLDKSGALAITGIKVTTDLVSKGIQAQPANPLTDVENKGNTRFVPSEVTSTVQDGDTAAPAEKVAPETMPEADKQPAMKDLGQAPSKDPTPPDAQPANPTSAEAPPAPHEKVPTAVAPNVLKTETAGPIETAPDASTTMHPAATQAAMNE